jgi:hypothetical protein
MKVIIELIILRRIRRWNIFCRNLMSFFCSLTVSIGSKMLGFAFAIKIIRPNKYNYLSIRPKNLTFIFMHFALKHLF